MRRLTAAAAALALSAAILAGCAPGPTALSSQVSTDMQSAVVAVAESAAAGDPTTALARLDELQQKLDAALAAGDVTAERAAAIQSAINAVRTDLQPAPAPSVEPAPAPEPTVDPGVTDDGGDDNSGPGNNNGNGKDDNGKGKGKDD
jgi:ribosomal protein S20